MNLGHILCAAFAGASPYIHQHHHEYDEGDDHAMTGNTLVWIHESETADENDQRSQTLFTPSASSVLPMTGLWPPTLSVAPRGQVSRLRSVRGEESTVASLIEDQKERPTSLPTAEDPFPVDWTLLADHPDGAPESLLCGICREVLTDAVMCNNAATGSSRNDEPCGHSFCEQCITRALTSGSSRGKCPLCRKTTKIEDLVAHMDKRREVRNLRLRCPWSSCPWVGAGGVDGEVWKRHALLECPIRRLFCRGRNAGCRETWAPNDATARDAHEREQCSFLPVPCLSPGCPERPLRSQLVAHLESCPRVLLPCPYAAVHGCPVKALQRSELDAHLRNSVARHLTCVERTCQRLQQENQTLRAAAAAAASAGAQRPPPAATTTGHTGPATTAGATAAVPGTRGGQQRPKVTGGFV